MKSTLRITALATIAAYVLIFSGGLVRVSGAGLGCPDWPTCFGRWIPPVSIEQLPPGIDPAQFNFTLAWIEYLNRLWAMIVGTLILISALLAVKHFRSVPRIYLPAVAAALLTAYAGWQGGRVVETKLDSTLVSFHAVLAILIGMLMLYTSQQMYYHIFSRSERGSIYPDRLRAWLAILLGISLIQVILGTNMRSTLEAFQTADPLAVGRAWLAQAGVLNYLHIILGALLVIPGFYLGLKVLLRSRNPSPLVWQGAVGLLILLLAQVTFGAFLLETTPPVLRVLHLWSGALITGLLLMLHAALRKTDRGWYEWK
jgi:cytochrome c oxidase assembly protein subunit 15